MNNNIEQFPIKTCIVCGDKTTQVFTKSLDIDYFRCMQGWHRYIVEKSVVYPNNTRIEIYFYHTPDNDYYFDVVSNKITLWRASEGTAWGFVQDFSFNILPSEWFAAKNIEEIINKINTLINFS